MSSNVTATYSGTGVNAGDILVSLLDNAKPPLAGSGSQADHRQWNDDVVVNIVQWQFVTTAGAATMEVTYDGVNWQAVFFQPLGTATPTTYIATSVATQPCMYFGNARGVRWKQSGVTAATINVMGWGYPVL